MRYFIFYYEVGKTQIKGSYNLASFGFPNQDELKELIKLVLNHFCGKNLNDKNNIIFNGFNEISEQDYKDWIQTK